MGITAATQLVDRGFEVYIGTTDPKHSKKNIGVAHGYIHTLEFPSSPAEREQYLEEVRQHLLGQPSRPEIEEFTQAMTAIDGILIAGGGNMNSTFGWLLYERAAYGLIAQTFNIPLVISGQSLGPVLTDKDSEILQELLSASRLVGVREISSYQWTQDHNVSAHHMIDDATFYVSEHRQLPGETVPDLPEQYICATFVGLDNNQIQHLARALDEAYKIHHLRTVFVPHKGTPGKKDEDYLVHTAIARQMNSEPIVLPILHADAAVSIHRNAYVAIANRYHPGVFSLSSGVPFIGLIPDAFTDMRLRGMMSHYGAENYTIPLDSADATLYSSALDEIIRRHDDISSALLQRTSQLRSFSETWWNAVEQALTGSANLQNKLPAIAPATSLTPQSWTPVAAEQRNRIYRRSLEIAQGYADQDREQSWEKDYQDRRDRMEPISDEIRRAVKQNLTDAPLASVVIPTLNAADVIGHQLECLSRQVNAPAFEVIISDNGSTDALAAVVDGFRDRLNVRIVDSSKIQNVSYARNVGIEEAQTDFILICDADDFVCEDWVRSLYTTLKNHPNSYVLGQYLNVADTGDLSLENPEIYQLFTQPKWQNLFIQEPNPHEKIEVHFFVGGASFGARKHDLLMLGGFDSSYKRGSDDWDFWARARKAGLQQVESYGAAVLYRISQSPRKQFRRNYFYALNDVLVTVRYPEQVHRDISLLKQGFVLAKTPYRLFKYKDAPSRLKTFSEGGYALGAVAGFVKYKLLRQVPTPLLMKRSS